MPVPAADRWPASGPDTDLSKAKAHWLDRDTLAVEGRRRPTASDYALLYAPTAACAVDADGS